MLPEKAFSPRMGRGFGAGGMTLEGGSGGGSSAPAGPTTTNVQNTNIPDYLQPYAETMLGATQQQLFNTQAQAPTYDSSGNQTNTGAVDITGVKPYVPYSSNPADYVAGFSPMQQAAQQATANLQVPGQYDAATQMTGQAGLGSLGLAGQEAQTGSNLAQASTNPAAVGAYMNPYIQNALAPSQQLLNQQYGMQGAQEQGTATSAGAFGGSREALMSGLNQQNRMLAQNQLVGNAYQQAYGNAQNQMNQVSQQGLAGQQAAMQGLGQYGAMGNQLAGIGGQQLGAQQNIIATQSQVGQQQQTQQQNIINQAIQNYATAQQYPEQQLSFMNSMLRGLPTQQTTTATYQAAPSTLNQVTGLGIAGLGAYNAFGGGAAAGSDINLKENIVLLWKADNGLGIYEFEYKPEFKDHDLCGHGKFIGYMAQEVEQIIPEAVFIMDNGYKAVNYDLVGRAA
jgi:hypothetical protein